MDSWPRRAPVLVSMLVVGSSMLGCGTRGGSEEGARQESATPRSTASETGELRTPPILQEFSIGGDFELVDHTGAPFRLQDQRGQVFLMFFGYTSCPDFCPATMALLTRAYERLGDAADEVTTLFVSVDPERDTPAKLAEYLEFFDIRALGLTGGPEQLDAVVPQYAARYEVEPTDSAGGPLFAHTTYIYLIDRRGRVVYTFMHNDTPRFIAAGIEQALAAPDGDA